MRIKKIFRELVRRNVIRAVIAYLAVAWALIEISSVILPTFGAPPYLLQGLIYLLAIGLIFWTGFAWIYDLTPDGWQKTPDWVDNTETRAANSRRLNKVIVGAGIIAVLLLLAGSFWAGSRWNRNVETAYNPEYRVAVLPLEKVNQDTEEIEALRTVITEDLIGELSRNHSLMVLSMASTQFFTAGVIPENTYFKSQSENVDYFISGSFEKSDNLLKVVIDIRKRLGEETFWSRSYSCDISESRKLMGEISGDITDVIGLSKKGQPLALRKEIRSISPETYEFYLKGKYYLNKSTVDDWKRGLVYLQEAIDRNPADPDAYAGMAEGYITWGHSLMPPDDVFPKALAAAKRAIQLDSTSAQGWASLSQYNTYFGWDWELAEYAFKKADSLNPNIAWNHYHHSWYLGLYGKMNEAIKEHKRAQELDPFTPAMTTDLAELYRWVGEYELGLEELEKVLGMTNNQNSRAKVMKGMILEEQGKIEEGLESMKEASEINQGWYVFYGPALFRNGKTEEAQKILKEVESMPETAFFSITLASMYHAAGNLDKTFEYLEKGKKHAWYPWFVRIYLNDENFRQDPRFEVLIRELNLPPPSPFEYDPSLNE